MRAGHCGLRRLQEFISAAPLCACSSKGDQSCLVDAVRKQCVVHNPSFWQPHHVLRVTETNGLGSSTTTIRFRLHELRKTL